MCICHLLLSHWTITLVLFIYMWFSLHELEEKGMGQVGEFPRGAFSAVPCYCDDIASERQAGTECTTFGGSFPSHCFGLPFPPFCWFGQWLWAQGFVQQVGSCSAIILFWLLGADLGVVLVMASFDKEWGKDGKKSKGKSTLSPLRVFLKTFH